MTDPVESVHRLLRAAGQTVATAESLTGGRLAAALTGTAGASDVYLGGVVTYATELKASLLGVSERIIEEHGVVSSECAQAMAVGVRALTGATYGVSTTGVAGPSEQEGKPPGTVFVGLVGPDGASTVLSLELVGRRAEVRDRTCREALSALGAMITGNITGNNGALG